MSHLCARPIEELNFHFPIEDEFAIQLGESLMACKSLQSFTLQVDPRMTLRGGAQALSRFLCSSLISTLEFAVASESATATMPTKETMQTLYVEGVQHSQNIRNLYLRKIVGDMQALATVLAKLHELTINGVDLRLSEVELLTRGLSDAHQLSELSLTACKLSDEHMIVLSPVVGNHPSIKCLRLTGNKIGDAGMICFVDHWKPESSIENLTLFGNDIGSKGAERLVQALSNRSMFRLLNLNHNSSIGYNGLKLIGEALPNARIQTLDLADVVGWTEYDDVNCDEAVAQEAQCTAACKALLEGVRGNMYLQGVTFNNPKFPVIVLAEIRLYTSANRLGRGALLENQHALPSGVWSYVLAKKGMSNNMMFLFLRERDGW